MLAIVAAWIGGSFVHNQTKAALRAATASERREKERLDRQHAGARAVLPLGLSAIADYAQACAESLKPLRAACGSGRLPPAMAVAYIPPELDPALIKTLRDVIETAPSGIADSLARLISDIQIYAARLRGIRDQSSKNLSYMVLRVNVDSLCGVAGVIYARVSDLFPYARLSTEEPPEIFPSGARIFESLRLLGIDEDQDQDVFTAASATAEFQRI